MTRRGEKNNKALLIEQEDCNKVLKLSEQVDKDS